MFRRKSSTDHRVRFDPPSKARQFRSSKDLAVRRAKRVQVALFILIFAILSLLASAFYSRPHVTTWVGLWFLGIIFFVSTEATGTLHSSQKTENKFWMGMALFL